MKVNTPLSGVDTSKTQVLSYISDTPKTCPELTIVSSGHCILGIPSVADFLVV